MFDRENPLIELQSKYILPCPSDSATSMASHVAEDVMQEADDAQLDISYEIYDSLRKIRNTNSIVHR